MHRANIVAVLAILTLHLPVAGAQELSVAIQPDIPPYVMESATKGLEVDLVHAALSNHKARFIQMPYGELETAVQQGGAVVALAVQGTAAGVSYSAAYLTFVNDAISKKADGLKIDSVADLKGHDVLTWQDAYLELGDAFREQYSPKSPQRGEYLEFADQQEQVRKFWHQEGSIVIIDRAIFRYFSEQMGHSMSEVELHPLFPAVTNFKAAFKDAALRDEFNAGLTELCRTGEYAKILERYAVELPRTVCD